MALRAGRLSCFLAASLVLRIGLVLVCFPLASTWEAWLFAVCLALALLLGLAGRTWLLRTEEATLREQLQAACAGLFLDSAEPRPGVLELSARGAAVRLRWLRLGPRLLLVLVPRVRQPGKLFLLFEWLSKQYPGPIPRIRIVLHNE
jgi:hypothetical protein